MGIENKRDVGADGATQRKSSPTVRQLAATIRKQRTNPTEVLAWPVNPMEILRKCSRGQFLSRAVVCAAAQISEQRAAIDLPPTARR